MGRRLTPKEKKALRRKKKGPLSIAEVQKKIEQQQQQYSFMKEGPIPVAPSYRGKNKSKARKQARKGESKEYQKELKEYLEMGVQSSSYFNEYLSRREAPYGFSKAWDVLPSHPTHRAFARCPIGNIRTLYHGTTSVASVIKSYLDPHRSRRGCMFGAGIYMGNKTKAKGYGNKYLLVLQARLGRIHVMDRSQGGTTDEMLRFLDLVESDSVQGKADHTLSWQFTLNQDEFVVYRAEQVKVIRILEWVPGMRLL